MSHDKSLINDDKRPKGQRREGHVLRAGVFRLLEEQSVLRPESRLSGSVSKKSKVKLTDEGNFAHGRPLTPFRLFCRTFACTRLTKQLAENVIKPSHYPDD